MPGSDGIIVVVVVCYMHSLINKLFLVNYNPRMVAVAAPKLLVALKPLAII